MEKKTIAWEYEGEDDATLEDLEEIAAQCAVMSDAEIIVRALAMSEGRMN